MTDWAAENGVRVLSAGKATGKKVAVVGGGPAGLTCAAELAKLGHAVTVFEARDMAGGLNTYGIVPLRLQVADSLAEVEMIRALGVEIKTGAVVGKDVRTADLLQSYDAVFLGLGLGKGWKLQVPGEELDGVYAALDLLAAAKTGQLGDQFLGRRVAVVGGGNTAIDAATVSKRLGAEVRHGLIQVDPESGRTSNPRVFAGGDCVRGGSEAVFAVQEGKRAARGIHAAIMGVR